MNFEFATAQRIVFGPGTFSQIGTIAAQLGKRPLVVTGSDPLRFSTLWESLAAQNLDTGQFLVHGEPTIETVRSAVKLAGYSAYDSVIGIGGGSVIDAAKAVAALTANDGDVLDYLEVVGKGLPLQNAPLPFIAIPTTAGTGAEVTRNAVLGSPEHGVKASLRSPLMLPTVALIDPELTYELPPHITASTGLDALTQLIEPFVSRRANPITDALCRDGIGRAARSLQRACENGNDAAAREDMALASLFGGLALANAGLGAVHGFAAPIGGMFSAPHGAVCAALLPHVMEANIFAQNERDSQNPALARFDEVARLLTGNQSAIAEDGIIWVQELCISLKVPPLSAYGIASDDFPGIAEKAAAASSMKANPLILSDRELRTILEKAV